MAGDSLLGIDIGTQGAKGVLCDATGHVVASVYREHTISAPRPGWAEHDADQIWWGAFVTLVRAMLTESGIRPAQVAAISVSGLVPGMLPLDAEGRPLRPAILYTDRRAQDELEEIVVRLQEAGLSENDTGPIGLGSPIPQLMWVRNREPEVFSRTARIVQCAPYIVYRLTGCTTVDHAMKRSYAPLYDPEHDGWSDHRAALLGLDINLLPERIAWATDTAGHVSERAARETGLAAGTPVAVGTADAFADMVGAGVVVPGAAMALYGSFTAVLIGHDRPVSTWLGYHCLPGMYFSGAGVHTGAALTRWFRDQFGQAELAMERALGENAYQWLDRQAAQVPPGCDGLVALPDFTGEKSRLHPALNRGALVGLTTSHSRAHVYRALLEAIAYELRFQLTESGAIPKHMTAVGGGARSPVWTQIMSDVLDVTQDVLDVPYSAPYGDAYLAGMVVGLFEDTRTLREKWIRVRRTIHPDPVTHDVYMQSFSAFRAVRDALM